MSGAACEMCAGTIDPAHGHIVDTKERRLLCSCRACELLFADRGAGGGRFKVVPRRCVRIPTQLFSDAQWEALGIPIGLAFFFRDGAGDRVTAFYPGPAGATESMLPLDAWQMLCEREPLIASMQADVEAALVYRRRGETALSYVVPIDRCYELVGLIRTTWRGIDGGDEAHAAIDAYFERLGEIAEERPETAV